jgi:hypothetical protein
MVGQLAEAADTAIAIKGGVRDSEKKDWHVRPAGRSLCCPVTTMTPLAK